MQDLHAAAASGDQLIERNATEPDVMPRVIDTSQQQPAARRVENIFFPGFGEAENIFFPGFGELGLSRHFCELRHMRAVLEPTAAEHPPTSTHLQSFDQEG